MPVPVDLGTATGEGCCSDEQNRQQGQGRPSRCRLDLQQDSDVPLVGPAPADPNCKKLDDMALSLNPLVALLPWRRKEAHAEELYGVIVAQARLPIFYQRFGVPDSLEGRFVMLSLHLFAVLHRLKGEGPNAAGMARDLADCFSADMEAVLRELGVGDLSVPKKVRKLVASAACQLEGFERAIQEGDAALEAAIAAALPADTVGRAAVSAKLTLYALKVIQNLKTQPIRTIRAGTVEFSKI